MPEISNELRGSFIAHVSANVPLCREHFRLELRLPSFPPTHPGHFVQLSCRSIDACDAVDRDVFWATDRLWSASDPDLQTPTAMLRRPFSLAGRVNHADGVDLHVIHRVVGVGTDWLANLREGDAVGLIGPLGNMFTLPVTGQVAILVGGGVGIPPMIYLADALSGRGRTIAFSGATTRDLLPLTVTNDAPAPAGGDAVEPLYNIAEFAKHGIPTVISTDDGSFGYRGFITQALEAYLDRFGLRGEDALIYTCGPEPMMKRVADIAIARRIPCQVAVERAMACGMGTCQSCCIRVKKPDPSQPPLEGRDWCYRLACTDGPIFPADRLLW
jgi:dihydroorotate dehydrogenase electron transfer subunit